LWLAPGFPPIVDAADKADTSLPAAAPTASSLLRELDARLPAAASLQVIVPAQWGPLDAQRLQLTRAVQWQVLPGRTPLPAVPAVAPLRLRAIVERVDAPALRYLRALHAAWALPGALPVDTLDAAQPDRWPAGTVAMWLSVTPPPPAVLRWVEHGGQLVLAADTPLPLPPAPAPLQPLLSNRDGSPLLDARAHGQGRVLRWAAALQPQRLPALLEADFPTRLQEALQVDAPAARAFARTLQPSTGSAIQLDTPPRPLATWLIALVLLLFALERWLASAARREALA
ncbi:hypothetical protein, partial [Xanthomonas maliensis]